MTGAAPSPAPSAALPSGQRSSAAPQVQADLEALADLRDRLDATVPPPSARTMRNPRRLHSGDGYAAHGLEAAIRNKNHAHLEAVCSNPAVSSGLGRADWEKARRALFRLRDPERHAELLRLESRLRPVAAELEALAARVRAALP